MKPLKYVSICLYVLSAMAASAQNCKPDTTIKKPGFYPLKLADGAVGIAYSQTVMVLSIKDTSVTIGGSKQSVTIDSVKMNNVIGLPVGIGYVCYEPRCIYLPSSVRCIKLSGTPTKSGVYPLKFAITFYAKISGFLPVSQPDTIRNYSLTVTGGSAHVTEIHSNPTLYPNPATHELFVSGLPYQAPTLVNNLGQPIVSDWTFSEGLWLARTAHLPAGIYFVRINGIGMQWMKQ